MKLKGRDKVDDSEPQDESRICFCLEGGGLGADHEMTENKVLTLHLNG